MHAAHARDVPFANKHGRSSRSANCPSVETSGELNLAFGRQGIGSHTGTYRGDTFNELAIPMPSPGLDELTHGLGTALAAKANFAASLLTFHCQVA
jgi:hypothetical protein